MINFGKKPVLTHLYTNGLSYLKKIHSNWKCYWNTGYHLEKLVLSEASIPIHTFLWFQSTLTDGFPRRKSLWSMTSSCMRDAEWIISLIIATCLWDGSSALYNISYILTRRTAKDQLNFGTKLILLSPVGI